ncbi:MAG: tol-pal system protein YbgF [Gammaproteobacteria bacterium]|nr:tol-pal system protein YbgF [Gammaproteobacteria bacterium]
MIRAGVAAMLLASWAFPVHAQSTRERLESLELQVTQLQEAVRGQALVELSQRLDALEAESRALRGDLDILQRENDERRKQQTDLASEFDRRIAAIEARLAAATSASMATAVVTPSTGEQTTKAGVVVAGQAAAVGSMPPAAPAAPSAPAATTPPIPVESPEVLYGRAFDALKAANYPEAVTGMSGFVAQFPTHPLADNAQYWLGQTYYVTRDYAKAIDAFAAVGSRSPDSSKAPDALLKKGLSELSLGRNDAARASFNEVLRRYPQNEAARSAREQLSRLR